MRHLIIIFISATLITLSMKAQEIPDIAIAELTKTNPRQDLIRSFWISGGLGPRALQTTPGSISTYYMDDSPSKDEFYSAIDIKDKYWRTGLNVEIGFGQVIGLSHSFFVDAAIGKSPFLWMQPSEKVHPLFSDMLRAGNFLCKWEAANSC